jgi:hypothetical protein
MAHVSPSSDCGDWDILQKFGIWGFCQNFLKNIVIPSREIPIFGEAPQQFWAIIAKFSFFGFLWMTRITEYLVLLVTRIVK